MKKRLRDFCIFMMFIALAASCQKQESTAHGKEEGASLVLHVDLPSISLGTKASAVYTDEESKIVSDPFGTDLTGWKEYEKLIDARVMYRLTMFLVDKEDGVLVGYRDLYQGSLDMKSVTDDEGVNGWSGDVRDDSLYATRATVTFNYDHPLHRKEDGTSLEQLSRGPFRMLLVANWAPAKADDFKYPFGDYEGLKNGDESFEKYVESIINEFKANIADDNSKKFNEYTDYKNIMDWALRSNADFLCPIAPQPLVLVQDIKLLPGRNSVSGQLKRTWARVRVSVENLSDKELTVRGIGFGDNTTRNTAYMFFDPDNEDKRFLYPEEAEYGSPNVLPSNSESRDALISFPEKGTRIGGLSSDSGNRKILFDGYILESNGKGNPFTYNLNLEYEGIEPVYTMDIVNDPIEHDLSRISEDMSYIIQNCYNQSRFLEYKTSSMNLQTFQGELSYLLNTSIQPEYRFKFERSKGDDNELEVETVDGKTFPVYYIKTDSETEYYLGQPVDANSSVDNIKLVSLADAEKFTVRNDGVDMKNSEAFLSFWARDAKTNGKRNYINVYGGNKQATVAGWYDSDDGSQFRLYPVARTEHKPAFNKDVTISTIDPETAHSTPLQVIRRNDFINILVTVSYSEQSGDIHFSVNEWNTGGGDIEFN